MKCFCSVRHQRPVQLCIGRKRIGLAGLTGPGRLTGRRAAAALGDNIELISLLHDLVAPEPELAIGDALAGLHIVLIAMPWADEVEGVLGEIESARGLVGHDRLLDFGDGQAFAGGAALMQAIIAVSVVLTSLAEDADLVVSGEYDPAVAIFEF